MRKQPVSCEHEEMMNRDRVLERFLRYVQVNTMASEESSEYPSSQGQLELGRLLVEELRQAGVTEAQQNRHGIVIATVPSTISRAVPTVAFCAHLDTSPETSGAGVKPQVIENYAGGDLVLPGDPNRVIRVSENPELEHLVGRTIITSDGTTLLGADDKAGVAAIMEAAVFLAEHPEIPHGPIRLCFTCDEEVGRGVDHIDLAQLGATVCYTLDGQGADTIDVETFSADLAIVTIQGVNIHPSIAKGRMTNGVRVAADFLGRLPKDSISPETTEAREGFLHPYEINGGVAKVTLRILLRDFAAENLAELVQRLQNAAAASIEAFPGAKIDVAVRNQYRNMAEGLAKEPRAVAYAQRALKRMGGNAELTIVRGGTDGSRLTEMGLPTPNLATGQHAPHAPLEWACLEEVMRAAEWIVEITRVWGEDTEQ
jgi:tripeptide aminopeptidase